MTVVDQEFVDGFLSKPVEWTKEAKTLLASFAEKQGIDPEQVEQDSVRLAKLIHDVMSWSSEEDGETGEITTHYCAEEIASIQGREKKQWDDLTQKAQSGMENPVLLIAIGAPEAEKTTLLKNEIADKFRVNPDYHGGVIEIDPNADILIEMPQYKRSLSRALKALERGASEELNETLRKYGVSAMMFAKFVSRTKWHGAANYIAQSNLNRAVEGRYNIAFGATATLTVDQTWMDNIASQCYRVDVLMVDAQMETKKASNNIYASLPNGVYVPDYDLANIDSAMRGNIPYLFNLAARTGGKLDLFWCTQPLIPARCIGSWWTRPGSHEPLISANTVTEKLLNKYDYSVSKANAEFKRYHNTPRATDPLQFTKT